MKTLPCLFVLTPLGEVQPAHQKRDEPPTPRGFPADEKPKKISLKDCKVGMVGRKSYEAKKAESLHKNIQAMIGKHGVERVVLCTLTFANDPKDLRTAQKRFNSIAKHLLHDLFLSYITAVHRGTERGRIHYHLIAVTREDVRTGFDFEGWNALLAHVCLFGRHNARYRDLCGPVFSSANPSLKSIWKAFRDRAATYGFGMVETYPIRSNAEAIGRYVGSYVRVAAVNRQFRDKRMRTLRYAMGRTNCTTPDGVPLLDSKGKQRTASNRASSMAFSWVEGAGAAWRAGCRMLGLLLGVDDFAPHFGKRWAWELRDKITLLGRYSDRMSAKFYEVAQGLAPLTLGQRYAQAGEFCRQLAAFEKLEASRV